MSLAQSFARLEERERKLLIVFFGVLAVMLLVLVPILVRSGVAEQAEANARIVSVLDAIEDERMSLAKSQAEKKRIESRYARKTPALASFLANQAEQVGLEIPETEDRSTVPRGKQFKERVSRIRLKRVGLLQFSNFMSGIEKSGFPVSISRLVMKKNSSKPDQYDVEMDVSAFDRETKKSGAKPDSEGR